MDFAQPQPNSFSFYRTHTIDAEGRRISIKERGVRRNEIRLDIISQLQTVTLTQEDAAALSCLLKHYAEHGTIATYANIMATLDELDMLNDELTIGAQPERVAWTKRGADHYTADLPSGAVLRVQWLEPTENTALVGWVGRCGCLETRPFIYHRDAQDAIMAEYLDSIEQDVDLLRASL